MNPQSGRVKSLQSLLASPISKFTCAVTLAFLVLSSTISRAQSTTSQVNGVVTDGTGAIVIGASVNVTNTATGLVYHSITDSLGAYHVTDLPPGSYTMDVTKIGICNATHPGFYADRRAVIPAEHCIGRRSSRANCFSERGGAASQYRILARPAAH